MITGSLRFRLLTAAALSILLALLLIGFLLVGVFDQHVRERMVADLGHQLDQLAALTVPDAGSGVKVDGEMTDPRFDQPLGGLYWQIERDGEPVARSRSLWDARLTVPSGKASDRRIAVFEVPGPGGTSLLAAARDVTLSARSGLPLNPRLIVASDLAELTVGRQGLQRTLAAGLAVAFVGLLLASWVQVGFGLKPLEHIRTELSRIRIGHTARIESERLPSEVRPLADEVNRFLDEQRETTERARRRAGDLAHGLKTPLAAVAAQADSLSRAGSTEAADALLKQVDGMRRHVERHLAVARSRGGNTSATGPVGPRVRAIIDLLAKLPRERMLSWTLEGEEEAVAAMELEDFDEVVGNLLDNAGKWAASRIRVKVSSDNGRVLINVEDDGPGIESSQTAEALERGRRLDERVQGTGLGLSIAQAILESYGSELSLMRSSSLGGLQARFEISAWQQSWQS